MEPEKTPTSEAEIPPAERVIPLDPGNETGPAIVVAIELDRTMPISKYRVHCWQRGEHDRSMPAMLPLVAWQLGQALQQASRWCDEAQWRMRKGQLR